jgi:multisubunit Na+/H+ antiporter MnhB subunit
MIRMLEVVLGLILIYLGLNRFSAADRIKGLAFAGLAIAGLILAIHGILLYNVPGFFKYTH